MLDSDFMVVSRFFCIVQVTLYILNHVTKYFTKCFTLKHYQHMIACVSSQCQNCECTNR